MNVLEDIHKQHQQLVRRTEYLFKKMGQVVAMNNELVELLNEWLRAKQNMVYSVITEQLEDKTIEILKRHVEVRD